MAASGPSRGHARLRVGESKAIASLPGSCGSRSAAVAAAAAVNDGFIFCLLLLLVVVVGTIGSALGLRGSHQIPVALSAHCAVCHVVVHRGVNIPLVARIMHFSPLTVIPTPPLPLSGKTRIDSTSSSPAAKAGLLAEVL